MNTTITYLAQGKSENSWFNVGPVHDTQQQAEAWVKSIRDDEDETYRIIKRETVITETVETVFTVPAFVPTIEQFIDEVAGYADGSRNIDWTGIERYSITDQTEIRRQVLSLVDPCDHCGIYHSTDYMNEVDGELLCDSCLSDYEACEEEEDEG